MDVIYGINWHLYKDEFPLNKLTHWGGVTLLCIGKLTIIGSDNGLSLVYPHPTTIGITHGSLQGGLGLPADITMMS